jgi:hypothetical protein
MSGIVAEKHGTKREKGNKSEGGDEAEGIWRKFSFFGFYFFVLVYP